MSKPQSTAARAELMNVDPQRGDTVEVVDGHRLGHVFLGGKRGEVRSVWTTNEGIPYVQFVQSTGNAVSVPANCVVVTGRAAA